ncbi:MAG: hypothetical protein ACT4OQ_09290 [Chloroflexota bacterium]
MLIALEGNAAIAHTVASLRAACEVLRVGAGRVSAVSLRGQVPEEQRSAIPVLSAAERLAAEYEYAVTMRLDGRTFEVKFGPRESAPRRPDTL